MRYPRWSRVVAALIFASSITLIASDLIRTSIQARKHSLVLLAEFEQIREPPGIERLGVGRFHKARLASVGARYSGATTRQRVFDHYRSVLEARGWRLCSGSASDNTDQARSVTAPEVFCRNDYRASVAWPSAEGSGTYSVTLEWNRITFGLWLIGVALLWVAVFSALVLVRGGTVWRRPGGRRSFRLRTVLRPPECVARLSAAAAMGDMVFGPKSGTDDQRTAFGLARRQRWLARNAFAPHFYGTLAADTRESGSTIDGCFGFRPETRATGAVVIVLAMITFGFFISDNPARDYEYAVFPIVFAIALVIGGRWMRRGDKRSIVEFLRTTLDARDV